MLKEIVLSIQSYFRAHRFIVKHGLWKWILIPGIIYMILFMIGSYYFLASSDDAVSYLSNIFGVEKWLQKQQSSFLSFLFLMSGIMVRFILFLLYFSLFKYLFLIIGSPLFAYLSEKTEAIIEQRTFTFTREQLLQDIVRSVKLSLRNMLWQSVYIIFLLILSFLPLVGWITPVITILIECYYYGFSMLDYSCERHHISASKSISFIGQHKGLAIGNGIVFYLLHLIPFLGWALAPAYAVVAATISLYHKES